MSEFRHDGYINVLNRYGTQNDSSEAYTWNGEPYMMDIDLCRYYETNGLFAKIIDLPAREALKHGYKLNINNNDIEQFIKKELKRLKWKSKAIEAIKWARLFGGSIIVMMVDDGKGLDEPLDMEKVTRIEELRVYDRSIVQPDYTSLYHYDPSKPWKSTTTKYGMPEFYYVFSKFGQFIVHESRCLILKNGSLPESMVNSIYQFWGIPLLLKIKQSLREAITSHSNANKLLDRCVQAIYKMKDLVATLESEGGDQAILKRLELLDMARGILNSIAIDKDGEEYDFKTMTLTGVDKIIDKACQMLSAITSIPQTILWGRSPAGENATGDSDFENYYNMVEGDIQEDMLSDNFTLLLDLILKAGFKTGKISELPEYELEFEPLWSLNSKEEAEVDNRNADTEFKRAQATQIYLANQVMSPEEVRYGLKQSKPFSIDTVLDEYSPELEGDWAMEAGLNQIPPDGNPGADQNQSIEAVASEIQTKWESRGMLRGMSQRQQGRNLIRSIREKWASRGFLRGKTADE